MRSIVDKPLRSLHFIEIAEAAGLGGRYSNCKERDAKTSHTDTDNISADPGVKSDGTD